MELTASACSLIFLSQYFGHEKMMDRADGRSMATSACPREWAMIKATID